VANRVLTPVVIVVPVVIAVLVATVVVVPVPYLMAVPVRLVPVAISIAIPSYLAAAVPAVVSVMIIACHTWISRKAPVVAVIGVVIISAAVVGIVIVSHAVPETRIIAETRFVGAPPLPVLPLALTVQTVVLHIVVMALCQPLAIGVIVVSAPVVAAVSVIRPGAIPVLGAAGKGQRSKNHS
jgi:hypothetical protein